MLNQGHLENDLKILDETIQRKLLYCTNNFKMIILGIQSELIKYNKFVEDKYNAQLSLNESLQIIG